MHRWQRVRDDTYKELVVQQSKQLAQNTWSKVLDELQSWIAREGQNILELYDTSVNRLVIPVDFMLLADEFPHLSEYLLKDYAGFQKSVLAACKIFLRSCMDFGKVDVESLRLWIRPFCTPCLPWLDVRSKHLQRVEGIIIAVESCSSETRYCVEGQQTFPILNSGEESYQNVCKFCSSANLTEDCRARVMFQVQFLALYLGKNQVVLVRVQDDLVENYSFPLGLRVVFCGQIKVIESTISSLICKAPGIGQRNTYFDAYNFGIPVATCNRDLLQCDQGMSSAISFISDVVDRILPGFKPFFKCKLCICEI
eukprot:751472-Hanusia_phi.AAC.8